MNPRALAERIAEALRQDPDVEAVEVAGPGFVNLKLSDASGKCAGGDAPPKAQITAARRSGRRKTNVEYVSANPTGPMHVGHCRGAVVGDALANLMAFAGYDVTKEYYINDAGAQIDVLARSALLRYREALGEEIGEIPAGLYPGDYLKPVGRRWRRNSARLLQMPEDEWLAIVKDRTIDAMMAMIREDLAALNVHHEVFFSERTLHADNARARSRTAINDLTLQGPRLQGQAAAAEGRSCPRTGKTASRRCSARPPSATTSTGRWSSRTAPSPISPPTSPISTTRSSAASTS
jgi:arginyl-tRNA synthetase